MSDTSDRPPARGTSRHAALALATTPMPLTAAQPDPAELVSALNSVFGNHFGKRASHAKGFCAVGEFLPASSAKALTKARLFDKSRVPATVRFSVGGGNPRASDKSRTVRGIAVHLSAAEESFDWILISEPVFFAATPESFLSFMAARVPDPATNKIDPARVADHARRFPDSQLHVALLAGHTAPASYATTAFFSTHAFKLIAADGRVTWARWRLVPRAGTSRLTQEQERTHSDDFLLPELASRLQQGAVEFSLLAQVAQPGDSLTDPTQLWPDDRPLVTLGQLRILSLTGQACADEVFVPTRLPAGIEPSKDPVLQARASAYAVSLARRSC